MISGRFAHSGEAGTVTVDVKETAAAFTIRMVHNTGRWIDPPLDDVLRTGKCVIKKGGSKHAMTFWEGGFCIYPFRVGVPFAFDAVDGEGGKTMTLEQFYHDYGHGRSGGGMYAYKYLPLYKNTDFVPEPTDIAEIDQILSDDSAVTYPTYPTYTNEICTFCRR